MNKIYKYNKASFEDGLNQGFHSNNFYMPQIVTQQILDILNESPDLVRAIADGKITNEFALAVISGDVGLSSILFEEDIVEVNQLQQSIKYCLESFYNKHQDLLRRDVNERSMTHKLAEELQKIFRDWEVDCEFNRADGDLPKKLFLDGERISSDDTDAKTVYPDIIIHKRGSNEENIVAIEVKKDGLNTERDEQKLKGFTADLFYRYGLLIILKDTLKDTLEGIRYFSRDAGGVEQGYQQILDSELKEQDKYYQTVNSDKERAEMEEMDRFLSPENYDESGRKIDVPEGLSGDFNGREYLEWLDSNDRS